MSEQIFDPKNPVFHPSFTIKTYTPHIAREFSDLAGFLYDDLKNNKHESGAIETGHPNSPSGYQRCVLSCAPSWYSELYWQNSRFETRRSQKNKPKKMIYTPIRRKRVLPALERIRDQTDLGTNLHSILREHIFGELIDPEKHNSFPVQDYFGLIVEEPETNVPLEAYESVGSY